MSDPTRAAPSQVASFRRKLIAVLMLVVSALTGLGLYLAQRTTAASSSRELQQSFQAEVASLLKVQELRHSALVERCAGLADKPRIHAALEDNALDLLYPSAKEELRSLLEGEGNAKAGEFEIKARFCRFLDGKGSVLRPPHPEDFGLLAPETEASLNLKTLPAKSQVGYLPDASAPTNELDEVTAVPIFSSENGAVISALVVGFASPGGLPERPAGMMNGIWARGRLYFPSLPEDERNTIAQEVSRALEGGLTNRLTVRIGKTPHLLFYKQLNPDSVFPPAYEVCLYPLTTWMAKLHRLRWEIAGAGVLLLLLGFIASHAIALRLAKPVEQLALDSAKDKAERVEAEAALASTSEELERSTRYSADASHQLKNPVTLMRTGLETLLAREGLVPEVYEELSVLLHQTRRLTSVIDDLLLLSRMDAGHLEIRSDPVNLSELIDEWLDDLEALPDAPEVSIEREVPARLYVAGEKQYVSLIVQNLLENARKYNRTGGRIRVNASLHDGKVFLRVGNTGRTIPSTAQGHVFERFYRANPNGAGGGHGIGLNLARELARLHRGDLRLLQSGNDWTEFEARFPAHSGTPERLG